MVEMCNTNAAFLKVERAESDYYVQSDLVLSRIIIWNSLFKEQLKRLKAKVGANG